MLWLDYHDTMNKGKTLTPGLTAACLDMSCLYLYRRNLIAVLGEMANGDWLQNKQLDMWTDKRIKQKERN